METTVHEKSIVIAEANKKGNKRVTGTERQHQLIE